MTTNLTDVNGHYQILEVPIARPDSNYINYICFNKETLILYNLFVLKTYCIYNLKDL